MSDRLVEMVADILMVGTVLSGLAMIGIGVWMVRVSNNRRKK